MSETANDMPGRTAGPDAFYLGLRGSAVEALFATKFPEGVRTTGWVPFDGLNEIADLLRASSCRRFADLGCGIGGPGLWLAQSLGAAIVGVDQSNAAVVQAAEDASRVPHLSAQFLTGDVCATGLPDSSFDAVVTLDVLQQLRDRRRFLDEVVRLLRPGGLVVLTTWEGDASSPERFPRDVAAEMQHAGLQVISVVDRPAWRERQLAIYQRVLSQADDAPDDSCLQQIAVEARSVLRAVETDQQRRRVLVQATLSVAYT
jgi:SAM-dependent methyltransferase